MLGELGWPSLESSLLLFHKIYCGAVSIEKDKNMTPAHSFKTTRSSLSAQYRRHQTYSDALKIFHIGIVCLLLWQIPSPQRSLGHSLFKQKFSQKFLCFFCVALFFFVCVCFFFFVFFYQNFQIRTPWCNAQVWAKPVKIERKNKNRPIFTSKDDRPYTSTLFFLKKSFWLVPVA